MTLTRGCMNTDIYIYIYKSALGVYHGPEKSSTKNYIKWQKKIFLVILNDFKKTNLTLNLTEDGENFTKI